MDDIRRSDINLKSKGFTVKPLTDESAVDEETVSAPVKDMTSTKVKVSFAKFVQLVATHDFENVMDKDADEEIVVSTNLLTDLANAHNGSGDKKLTMIFVVGLIIGIVATYFLVVR